MARNTYENILETAHNLFIQQGYTATSMRQIAEVTGIGKATIYHHFPDKEALASALFDRHADRGMDEALLRVRAESDPRKRIETAAEASAAYLFESGDIVHLIRREIPRMRERMSERMARFFKEYMALLAEAIEQGIEQGIFRSVDPADAARVLITMFQGTFAMRFMTNARPDSPKKTAAMLLDIFFKGIETSYV